MVRYPPALEEIGEEVAWSVFRRLVLRRRSCGVGVVHAEYADGRGAKSG